MEKTAAPLALLLANPLILAIGLIFVAVIFIIGYVFLWAWGLVTAAVLFVAGLFLLFMLTRADNDILKRHPWLVVMPLGLGIVPRLSMLSLAGDSSTSVDPAVLTVIILGMVMILLVVAIKGKRKRKR